MSDFTQGSDFQGTGDESQGQETNNSLAEGVLAQIPEADRPVVEKYLKTWDSNVSKRFQEIHESYKPYKDLGEVEDLKAWVQAAKVLQEDPEYVYELLAKELGKQNITQEPPKKSTSTAPVGGGQKNFQELPPEILERLDKSDQILDQLARAFIAQATTTKQEQEDAQLDSFLDEMHREHGDFDEDYVLLKIYNGADPVQAIQDFQSRFGGSGSNGSRGSSGPPVLTGGGIGAQQQNVKDMTQGETKALVANILGSLTKD